MIRIFQRHCNFSTNSEHKQRPEWFDREKIFDSLMKTIHNFEQGSIKNAKDYQKSSLQYINKAIFLLLKAMEEMQKSNSASGYSEYLKSMQELIQGQQLIGEGMQSLPMPFGQNPGQDGLLKSLMEQQEEHAPMENLMVGGEGVPPPEEILQETQLTEEEVTE